MLKKLVAAALLMSGLAFLPAMAQAEPYHHHWHHPMYHHHYHHEHHVLRHIIHHMEHHH
ncbi:MAG TPA: hypothetical protein VL492_12310 [Methylovirgula sp.]|nr:hypothetical protein [Methylovirgula sp.]